jgi:hypothetical protein
MNMKLAIVLSLVCIVSLGFWGQAFAQTRVPGLQPGDTLTYGIVSYLYSENANATIPVDLIDANNTSQYQVIVSGVSGPNITATHVWDFKNGTSIPYLLTIDVESGQSYYTSMTYPPFEGIAGANIDAGQLLHPTGNDTITIKQTISRNYAHGSREINVINLSTQITNSTDDTIIGSQNITYYLDKATGALVEQDVTLENYSPQESISIIWTLKQSSIWDVSPPFEWTLQNLLPVIAVVVVIIVLAAVLVYRKRRKRRKKKYR